MGSVQGQLVIYLKVILTILRSLSRSKEKDKKKESMNLSGQWAPRRMTINDTETS